MCGCVRECECAHTNPVLTTTQRSGFLIVVIGNYGWGGGETQALGRGQFLFSIAVKTLGLSSPSPQPASSSTSWAVSLQPRRSVGSHFTPQCNPTSKSNNFWGNSDLGGEGLLLQPSTPPQPALTRTLMPWNPLEARQLHFQGWVYLLP